MRIFVVLLTMISCLTAEEEFSFSLTAEKIYFSGFEAYYSFVGLDGDMGMKIEMLGQRLGSKKFTVKEFVKDTIIIKAEYDDREVGVLAVAYVVSENFPTTIIIFSLDKMLADYERQAYPGIIPARYHPEEDINAFLKAAENWRLVIK